MTITRQILKKADQWVNSFSEHLQPHPKYPTLDPFLHQILKLKQKRNIPSLHQMELKAARHMFSKEMNRIKANFKVKKVKDRTIPLQDCVLNIRHYQPAKSAHPTILVFFHGGGGVIGDLNTHDDICRLLCQTAEIHVIAVDYRLAPEYPAPVAQQDALNSCKWIYQNRHKFYKGAESLCLAGDSAGGNLAISAGLALKRQGIPVLAQLLFYPSTDFTKAYPSETTYAEGLFLDTKDRHWFQKFVFNDQETRENPNVSVILADDLGISPPTVLRTAELDTLRDQGEIFLQKLKLENIDVNFKREIGLGHGYANFIGVSQRCYDAVVEATHALVGLLQDK